MKLPFDANKLYASEIMAILLQNSDGKVMSKRLLYTQFVDKVCIVSFSCSDCLSDCLVNIIKYQVETSVCVCVCMCVCLCACVCVCWLTWFIIFIWSFVFQWGSFSYW